MAVTEPIQAKPFLSVGLVVMFVLLRIRFHKTWIIEQLFLTKQFMDEPTCSLAGVGRTDATVKPTGTYLRHPADEHVG